LIVAGRGVNDTHEEAVRPPVVTVIGAYVAPRGAVTMRDVSLANVTAATTPPNRTTFDETVPLNPEPEIVIVLPGTPDNGEIDVITGTPPQTRTARNRVVATTIVRMCSLLAYLSGAGPSEQNNLGGEEFVRLEMKYGS